MDSEKYNRRQTGNVLRAKTEEEIQESLNRLPPAKRFSVILRNEIDTSLKSKDITSHEMLVKSIQQVVNHLEKREINVHVDICPPIYDPTSFQRSVNIRIEEMRSNSIIVVTVTNYDIPAED